MKLYLHATFSIYIHFDQHLGAGCIFIVFLKLTYSNNILREYSCYKDGNRKPVEI